MRYALIVCLLASGLAGCHGPWRYPAAESGPPECYRERGPPRHPCPPGEGRCEAQPTEEIVYAPRPKVIIESSVPCQAPAAAPQQPSFAPQQQAFAPAMTAPMPG